MGVVVLASEPASAATAIDRCTTIRSSGTYELTRNIESSGTCITITASNVIFDGQGHTIEHVGEGEGTGVWVVAPLGESELEDVVVRDVTVTGYTIGIFVQRSNGARVSSTTVTHSERHGIRVDGNRHSVGGNTVQDSKEIGIVTRGDFNSITANTVHRNGLVGIYVQWPSTNAVVRSNTVTRHDGSYLPGNPGILLRGKGEQSANHVVEANRLSANNIGILVINWGGNTIRFNTNSESVARPNDVAIRIQGFSHGHDVSVNTFESGINVVGSDDNIVAENDVGSISVQEGSDNVVFDNDVPRVGVIESARTMVLGNRILGDSPTPFGAIGINIDRSRDTTVRGNVIEDRRIGVKVLESLRTDVHFNDVRNNAVGVHIFEGGASTTRLTANNFVGNTEYGVKNEVAVVVDARFNYWGAANGPSSPSDVEGSPLEDPVTGALADGDGDAVSESPVTAGVSNVRFHPWSRAPNPVTTLPPFDPGPPGEPPRGPPAGPSPITESG